MTTSHSTQPKDKKSFLRRPLAYMSSLFNSKKVLPNEQDFNFERATPEHDVTPYQSQRPEEHHSVPNEQGEDADARVGSPVAPQLTPPSTCWHSPWLKLPEAFKEARATRRRTRKASVTENDGRAAAVAAKIKSAFKRPRNLKYPKLKKVLAPILDNKRGAPESTQEVDRPEDVDDLFEGLSTAEYYSRRTSECENLSNTKAQEIAGTNPGPRRSIVGTLDAMENPTIVITGPTGEGVDFIEPNYAAESHHAYGVDEEEEYAPEYHGPLAAIAEHVEELEYLQPTVYSPERGGLQLASELESDRSTDTRRYTTTVSGLAQNADIHRFDHSPRTPATPVPRGVRSANPEIGDTRVTSWVSSVSGVAYDEPVGNAERPSRGVETVRSQRPRRSVRFEMPDERPHRGAEIEDDEVTGSGERRAHEESPASRQRLPSGVETVRTERSPRRVETASVESADSENRRSRAAIGIGSNYEGGPDYVHRSVRPVEPLPSVTQQRERRLVRRPAADEFSYLPSGSGMGMHVPVRMAQDSDLLPGTYRGVRFASPSVNDSSILAFSRRPIVREPFRAVTATRPVRRGHSAQEASQESSRSATSSVSTIMPSAEGPREPIGVPFNSSSRATRESAESNVGRRSDLE